MADVSIVLSGADDQDGRADGPFYLTNSAGWLVVWQWLTLRAARRFVKLQELARRGKVAGTDRLGIELAAACVLSGRASGVLWRLAKKVGVGDPNEIAVIVSGSSGLNDHGDRMEAVDASGHEHDDKGLFTGSGGGGKGRSKEPMREPAHAFKQFSDDPEIGRLLSLGSGVIRHHELIQRSAGAQKKEAEKKQAVVKYLASQEKDLIEKARKSPSAYTDAINKIREEARQYFQETPALRKMYKTAADFSKAAVLGFIDIVEPKSSSS